MSASKTPAKQELLPFQKENVATNQQAVALPCFAGTRVIAARWCTPSVNRITTPAKSGGKKGGGGGGKKGGGAQQSQNHYATIAVAFGWGPLDWLKAVIHNGNYLWQGDLTVSADVTDLTGSILDPELIAAGGYLNLYRGTETQPGDTSFANSPRDKGTIKIVGRHIFYGQDSGTAPNLQIIGGRLPRVPVEIVAAEHNVADDGQINPIAFLAEVLLDERGAGYDLADLDATSWLAAAAWCHANRAVTFCSPLFTEQSALRNIVRQLLEPFHGYLCRTKEGKLACRIYEWGVDPGGLPLLDARHLVRKPRVKFGDWDDVPTEILVKFTDRDYEYQDNTVLVPNARASQIRQVEDQRSLDRRHVTRIAQAHRQAAEYLRRVSTAPVKFPVSVLEPFIENISVGDKLKVDIDPEPGGVGLAQLVRVERIERDASDEASVTVVTDALVPATPFTPNWTPDAPGPNTPEPMEHFLAVPLPPARWGLPPKLAVLATRPSRKIEGFELHYGLDPDEAFAELGQQFGFAVRLALTAAVDESETTLQLELVDGEDGPDAELAGFAPGSEIAARDEALLLIIANVTDGRVVIGADGLPEMEIISVVSRDLVSAGVHDYEVLRGRQGLTGRAWTTDAKCWALPAANLMPWSHADFAGLLQEETVGYLRLVSFSADAFDETSPVPEATFEFPPAYSTKPRIAWTNPATSSAETDAAGDITVSGTVTDRQGDLISLRIDSRRDDGTSETTHYDQGFPATNSRPFSLELTFAGHASEYRVYTLRIEARDSAGNVTIQSRTIVRPPTGTPSGPPPPAFTPAGDSPVDGYTEITITAAAPATEIHWAVTSIGTPTAPGSYNTAPGLSVGVGTFGGARIWARASDGTNHSAWVPADYYRMTGGSPIER